MAYLEISIAHQVRRFALEGDHLRIGRQAENDIVLRDGQISRQHAELQCTAGRWRILDLGSTNGLHFKGRRVQEHVFNAGDLLLLAPDITLCFREGASPGDAIVAAGPRSVNSPPAPRTANIPKRPIAPAEAPTWDPLHPRSPFADDEQPYYPPGIGMPAPPTHYNRQFAPGAAAGAPTPSAGQQQTEQPTASSRFDTIPAGGYPAPSGPMTSGSDGQDPFRRSSPNSRAQAHRATAGPSSALLHVCQTCGQLTAPDAVYCQSCHHSIARECVNCRLSLLPIQDRCPRCQTPNPGSVRRAHRAPGA